jgi:hypothetical protein
MSLDDLRDVIEEGKLVNETEIDVEAYERKTSFNGLTPLRLIGIRAGTQSLAGKLHTGVVVLGVAYFVVWWTVTNALLLGPSFYFEGLLPSVLVGAAGIRSIFQFRFLVTGFRSRKLIALDFVVKDFEQASFLLTVLSLALMGAVFSILMFESLSNGYLYGQMMELGASHSGAIVLVALNEISNFIMFSYTASAMSVMSCVAYATWMRQRAVRHTVDKLRHFQRDANAVTDDCRQLSKHLAVLDRHGSTALKASVGLMLPPLVFFLVDFLVSWIELLRKAGGNVERIYLPISIDLAVFLALIVPACFATHASDQLRSAFRRWFVAMNGIVQAAPDLVPNDQRMLALKLVLQASQKASCRARLMQQEFSFSKLLSLSSFIFFLTVWKFIVSV